VSVFRCLGCGRPIAVGVAHRCSKLPLAGPWLRLADEPPPQVPEVRVWISEPPETITAALRAVADETAHTIRPRSIDDREALPAAVSDPIITCDTLRRDMETARECLDRIAESDARLDQIIAEMLAGVGMPPPESDRTPPPSDHGAAAKTEPVVRLEVHRLSHILHVSDEVLMDTGVIPDTRPPVPPPSRRARLRRWWRVWRERTGVRVGSWLAGDTLTRCDGDHE
jgi:hypothetical protein